MLCPIWWIQLIQKGHIGSVLLPPNFKGLLHSSKSDFSQERLFLFDSFATHRTILELLKSSLTSGGCRTRVIDNITHKTQSIPPLLSPNAIFVNNSYKSVQAAGDNSCGYWSVFSALMTVLEGNDDFWRNLPDSPQEQFKQQVGLFLRRHFDTINQNVVQKSWKPGYGIDLLYQSSLDQRVQSLKGGNVVKN